MRGGEGVGGSFEGGEGGSEGLFRGGEGSKKPLSTPLHHDTPLSGGASRRADRGRAAWVVAERSGASRASRMGGRGAKRSEQGKPHGWSRSGAERAGQAAWLRASGASDAHHGSAGMPPRAARLLRSLKGALRHIRRPSVPPHGSARSEAERCTSHGSAGMPPRAARLLRSLKGALRHIRRPSVPPHGSARSEAERCTSHGSAGMPPRAARLLRSLKGALRHIRRPSVPPHGSARSEAERCTYRWSCPGKKIAPN